jgi:hypothetical protein
MLKQKINIISLSSVSDRLAIKGTSDPSQNTALNTATELGKAESELSLK